MVFIQSSTSNDMLTSGRSGPVSSLFWILSTPALQSFGSSREASGATLMIANGERFLIYPYIPSSSVLFLLLASGCRPRTVSSTCVYLLEICPAKVFFTRPNSSRVSFRSSLVSFVCTSSSAFFNYELDEAASLLIS